MLKLVSFPFFILKWTLYALVFALLLMLAIVAAIVSPAKPIGRKSRGCGRLD